MGEREISLDKIRKNFYITLVVFITVVVLLYIYTRPVEVIEVQEGFVLVLNNGKAIRLMGVEVGSYGEAYLREKVEGKQVTVEYDQDKGDRDGYPLAYVYLRDGTFVNGEMIRQGFARRTKEVHRYLEEFDRWEREAQAHRRGMWSR